jgi:hypothetical protein
LLCCFISGFHWPATVVSPLYGVVARTISLGCCSRRVSYRHARGNAGGLSRWLRAGGIPATKAAYPRSSGEYFIHVHAGKVAHCRSLLLASRHTVDPRDQSTLNNLPLAHNAALVFGVVCAIAVRRFTIPVDGQGMRSCARLISSHAWR